MMPDNFVIFLVPKLSENNDSVYHKYRELHQLADFCWVDFYLGSFAEGADEIFAEITKQMDKILKQPKSMSTEPKPACRWNTL